MYRLSNCLAAVAIVTFLGSASAMAQVTNNQSQPNRATTTVGGTAGVSTSPTMATPGGTNLNQGTGAQPTLQDFGSGFVGNSQNSGRFVGSQFSGQQQVQGGGSSGRNTFGSSASRGRGGTTGRRSTMPNQGARSSRTKRVRPRLRVAFITQPRSMTTVKASLDTRFSKLLSRRTELAGVSISVGKVAGHLVLAGKVPNESALKKAAALVRMEPGVRKVDNQLVIAQAEPTNEK